MVWTTLFIFLIVNLVADSYGQKENKFFRKDYTYLDDAESFYKIHSIRSTWADAKRVCALEGATFWHPESEKEISVLISFWVKTRPTAEYLWTALSDKLVEGRFETIDGRPSSEVYMKWYTGQPQNLEDNEDCTYIDITGYTYVYDCEDKDFFVCKKTLQSLEWNNNCDMPNLDYIFSRNTGKCYKLHTTPLKWTDANERCQIEQSTLALIKNEREADYLVKLMESTPKPRVNGKYQRGIYHMGFHNKLKDGWQTVKGTPLKVDRHAWWDNYQPDTDDREQCGAMFFNGRLININCDMKSFFICEHEVDNVIAPVYTASIQPYLGGGIE